MLSFPWKQSTILLTTEYQLQTIQMATENISLWVLPDHSTSWFFAICALKYC